MQWILRTWDISCEHAHHRVLTFPCKLIGDSYIAIKIASPPTFAVSANYTERVSAFPGNAECMDWGTSLLVEVSTASLCAPRESIWSSRVGMCGWGGPQGFLILGCLCQAVSVLPTVCVPGFCTRPGGCVGVCTARGLSFPSGSVCKQTLLLSETADIF